MKTYNPLSKNPKNWNNEFLLREFQELWRVVLTSPIKSEDLDEIDAIKKEILWRMGSIYK